MSQPIPLYVPQRRPLLRFPRYTNACSSALATCSALSGRDRENTESAQSNTRCYPDGVADRFKGPRGVEDGARVIDGFGHASGHPCPTMTHRVTLRYILDTMMHAITFLLISFFSPSPFLSYLYLYLFSFPSPPPFFSISLTCAAVETSTTSYRCQRCARSSPATACARTVADPVAR